jgi:hypothetical protein
MRVDGLLHDIGTIIVVNKDEVIMQVGGSGNPLVKTYIVDEKEYRYYNSQTGTTMIFEKDNIVISKLDKNKVLIRGDIPTKYCTLGNGLSDGKKVGKDLQKELGFFNNQ